MSLLFNINHLSNDFSPFINREIDKSDLKNITQELCRAYKKGMIPEGIFHQTIEHLLAFFIERTFDDKIFSKNHILDEKLNKFQSSSKW
jgi:hypothetical protein